MTERLEFYRTVQFRNNSFNKSKLWVLDLLILGSHHLVFINFSKEISVLVGTRFSFASYISIRIDYDPIPFGLFYYRVLIIPLLLVFIRSKTLEDGIRQIRNISEFHSDSILASFAYYFSSTFIIAYYFLQLVVFHKTSAGLVYSDLFRSWHDRWSFAVNGMERTSRDAKVYDVAPICNQVSDNPILVINTSQIFAKSAPTPFYFKPVTSHLRFPSFT